MKIESLVKGETIKLDNHHRNQPIGINDTGLHLHKRYNDNSKKKGKAEVIIPLNQGEIRAIDTKGKNSPAILKEIRKAFSNLETRKAFVESVKESLSELAAAGTKDNNENPILNDADRDTINNAIIRIAEQFGFSKDDIEQFLFNNPKRQIGLFKKRDEHLNVISHAISHLYIIADVVDVSFTLTSAKYMAEKIGNN